MAGPKARNWSGSYETQPRICEHILTARQRLDELLLGEGTLTTLGSCEPGPTRATPTVQEPIEFQSARGNAVDEQLKLRDTWAAIGRANAVGPALNGQLSHRPSTDAMRRVLTSFRAVTGLGYDAVPPRTLNELPDQGIEALIDLIMQIEEKCD